MVLAVEQPEMTPSDSTTPKIIRMVEIIEIIEIFAEIKDRDESEARKEDFMNSRTARGGPTITFRT